ncbi:uncharacterized protein [Argopecten irradians]|uniref:uncharacterized protein n=1 Tax=Argopecten irradians TaxID=31199 RepID=UPI00371AFBA8
MDQLQYVSDNLRHGPAAIWAHLHPVIQSLKEDIDSSIIYFIINGPTTQYRNKINFYLFATKVYEYGFTCASLNFLEAGHGKGAADGIGGVIKRKADDLVNVQGKDITCAKDLLEGLKSNVNVHLHEVVEEEIDKIESGLPNNLKPLPKTMQIHQLQTVRPGEVKHRVLSCFSCQETFCNCFNPVTTSFTVEDTAINLLELEARRIPQLIKVENVVCKNLKSKYCVMRYDGRPYPRIILDVDEEEEEVEVKVMHCVGVNRFFGP